MRRRPAATVLAVFIIVAVAAGSSRARVQVDSIAPPFAGSYLNFIDDGGTFLESRNATFQLKLQQSPSSNGTLDSVSTSASFFLVVIHTDSGVTVWIANRDRPVNASTEFVLADAGAYLQSSPSSGAGTVWSVSAGASGAVRALRLRDDGNLLLLGAAGVDDHNHNDNVLWQSFDHPTDTLLPGQRLALGVALVAPASADDYASGAFRAEVKASDLKLLWTDRGQAPLTYWTATSDSRSVQVGENVSAVAYAELGASALGLYDAASVALLQLPLPSMGSASSALRRAALDPSGQLTVWTYTAGQWVDAFDAVQSACLLPTACGPLGICSTGSGVAQCSCPAGLMPRNESYQAQGCTVAGPRSAVNCSVSASDNAGFSAIASGVGYSGNNFTAAYSLSLHSCEMRCRQNCSCVLYFYQNGSGSGPGTCYTYDNVGTLTAGGDFVAYLKIFQNESPSPAATVGDAVNSRRRSLAVILGLSLAMMLLATMLLGLLIFSRLRRQRVSKAHDEASLRVVTERLPARFTYAELAAATANFTREIGRGAYGVVYEGALPDGTRVAVKKLESTDDHKNFHTEIKTIGALHHVNVVSLRGYCAESGRRLLVYEHMNRGSLDRHLFSAGTAGEAPLLSWSERYAVAVGAARGLEYLHSACRDTIIHCDIKPENILLDDRGHTKVADFGLARLLPAPDSGSAGAAVTTLCGTRGYLAPEWLAHLPITDRADVYSFGMVLLELVSGRKNCHAHDRDHDHDHCRCVDAGGIQGSPQTHYFPAYAVQMWESGRAAELADVRLGGCVNSAEVERLVQVALWCVQEDPELRPSMHAVVLALEGLVPPGEPQMKELQFLRMYARRFDNSTLTPAAVFLLADSASSSSMSSAVLWPSTVLLNRFASASPLSPLSAEAEDADADISAISSAQLSGAR